MGEYRQDTHLTLKGAENVPNQGKSKCIVHTMKTLPDHSCFESFQLYKSRFNQITQKFWKKKLETRRKKHVNKHLPAEFD